MNRSESNLSSGKIVQTEFTNLVLRYLLAKTGSYNSPCSEQKH